MSITTSNLEFYRKQAKALLKSAQSHEPAALEKLHRHAPKLNPPAPPKLHDAQLAIAREQGFPSWPRFRAYLLQSGLDHQALVAAFLDAATSDRRRAEQLLAGHPNLAEAGFYAALVLGNVRRVERTLSKTPTLATGPGGPQNCEPLLYVCFSRFAHRTSPHAADLVETARTLLRHGANANAALIPADSPNYPLSCLYAATGLNNNPALALVLLEAGATPNDNESLYHATEHPDLECLGLLLAHGAAPARTNALKHILDREDPVGLQLLLDAGADPNEVNAGGQTALHWAIWRGRTAPLIAALLDHGANLNARSHDGRTPYALAMQSGQTEVAALLASRGAATELSPLDQYLAAAAAADPSHEPLPPPPGLALPAFSEHLLPDLAMSHRTSAVRALLAAGMPVNARGAMGATALHWACWKGYPDLVELLLQHGASLTIEDSQYHGTPPGWFGHGVHNCDEPGGDYPGVARLLIAAGATIPAVDIPTGNPEVDAVLREHGLL